MPGASPIQPARFSDLFTDRSEELAAFRSLLAQPSGTPLPVRAYVGVTGAGKTFLKRMFVSNCDVQRVPVESLDYESEGRRGATYDEATIALRLIGKLQCSAPRTLLASAFLGLLEAESAVNGAAIRHELMVQASGSAIELLIKNMAESGVSPSLDGILGSLVKFGFDVFRRTRSDLSKYLKTEEGQRLKAELAGIRESEAIRRQIFDLFAQDLVGFQPNDRAPGLAVKGVLIVDALEHATIGKELVANREAATRWIWRLHQACNLRAGTPPMLAILTFGQVLPYVPSKHEDKLQTVNLQGFSEKDARIYCEKRGIEHEIEIAPILRDAREEATAANESRFHVFSLGLLCDAWALDHDALVAEQETLDGLDRVEALIRRFLKLVDRQGSGNADKLRKLATTPVWDDEAAAFAFGVGANLEESRAKAIWIKSLSFVQPIEDGITFHAVMRRVLLETASAEDLTHWHGEWAGHWRSRSVEPTDKSSARAWRHEFAAAPMPTLQSWNSAVKSARNEFRMVAHAWLVDLVEDLLFHPLVGSVSLSESERVGWVNVFANESSQATLGDLNVRLNSAVRVYRQTLEVTTRESAPLPWAMTQSNLGSALHVIGERENRIQALTEAVAAFRLALEVYTHEAYPEDWAMTQSNLGNVQRTMAERGNDVGALNEAVAAYRLALEVLTFEYAPSDWAKIQHNLGNALQSLGEIGRDILILQNAIAAYRSSLVVRNRQMFPAQWANTQNSLGTALAFLGEHEKNIKALNEAIVAFRLALEVYSRESGPTNWAMTQNNLGNVLRVLGEREIIPSTLNEAIVAFRLALEVYTREAYPAWWAMTQNNLGIALKILGESENDITTLNEALIAFHLALQVYECKSSPAQWAMTQSNLSGTMRSMARLTKDQELATGALIAVWKAFRTYRAGNSMGYAQTVFGNLLLCGETCRELGADIPPEIQEFLDDQEKSRAANAPQPEPGPDSDPA